jgi:uncharacterized delta-60 repeat protein
MKICPKLVISLLVAALCFIHAPALANGSSDPDFNNGNFVLKDGGLFQEAKAIAQQGNKIIVAGSREDAANWNFLVARFTSTGELDLSFGADSNGYVTLDVNGGSYDLGIDLAITPSNEIYVYGSSAENLTIVKLNADGTPSNSFGISGVKTIFSAYWDAYNLVPKDIEVFNEWVYFSAAYREDVSGSPGTYRYALYRMSDNGTIDEVFSQAILDLNINGFLGAMKVDSSGNVYLAGDDNFSPLFNARIVKINPLGGLVVSFAGTGIKDIPIYSKQNSNQLNSFVTQLKISNSGQIFAVGSSYDSSNTLYEVFVVNFNSDGVINQFTDSDSTSLFDANQLFYSSEESIALQNDGKFLVSTTWGNSSTLAVTSVVARFNSAGDLDTSFGVNGRVSYPENYFVNSIQIQANQRLLVAGRFGDLSSSDLFLSRLRTALPPEAPTIGAATATGSSTATVSFTAPISNGGATITSYTATSSPGGFTGTLSGASGGTITMTGLSASTEYSFTVTATNSQGTSSGSSASNFITTSASSSGGTAADELRKQQEAAAAAKQKQDQELREILSLVPTIAGLAQGVAGLGNSLLLPKKCVKGKLVKNVKAGAKCPKGYKIRR